MSYFLNCDILLKYILLIMLLQLSHFVSPFISLCPTPHSLQHSPAPYFMSWVIHISSLASPIPTLLLTSSCLFCTYLLCFLISVLYPCPPLPTDNPPFDRYIYDSVPVLVVCLVCFCFLDSVVDSREFVVILLFIVLIIFFLNKSL